MQTYEGFRLLALRLRDFCFATARKPSHSHLSHVTVLTLDNYLIFISKWNEESKNFREIVFRQKNFITIVEKLRHDESQVAVVSSKRLTRFGAAIVQIV